MQRKTFRRLRSKDPEDFHHHVYVVELSAEAKKDPRIQRANPDSVPARPCVYVGMTGLLPEQRFENHKQGVKASEFVHRYGPHSTSISIPCLMKRRFKWSAIWRRT